MTKKKLSLLRVTGRNILIKMKPYDNGNISNRNLGSVNMGTGYIDSKDIYNIVSEIKSLTASICANLPQENALKASGSCINKINIMEVCGTHTMSMQDTVLPSFSRLKFL